MHMYVVYNWRTEQYEDEFGKAFQTFLGTKEVMEARRFETKKQAAERVEQFNQYAKNYNCIVMKLSVPYAKDISEYLN